MLWEIKYNVEMGVNFLPMSIRNQNCTP